ncbi:MAG: ATP-dependent DNA helicase RecQ, partial [Myxococcales bacterium]|nr:ATP-dependent DNA helicase RecQ [Myxococcales bacterium]
MVERAHEHAGGEPGDDVLDAALARLGYERFRPGQREAVATLLERGRLLLVAPTGGGKSLTYQLPAVVLRGTTLVVSPLIALMHDQVTALAARGVRATYLASTLEPGELGRRTAALAAGQYDLVYVAPERLGHGGLQATLATLEVPLIAIDEAHCIAEWGHDFRPDYLAIGRLLARKPRARVLACTATATPVVRDEILERLGLPPDTPQIVHGFARPNLVLRALEAESARERRHAVDAVLAEALGPAPAGADSAIVYAPTRAAAEAEAERLRTRGHRAVAYHAGLDGAVRERVQGDFMSGRARVVVATNAFGMGIDRSDVRAVVHLAPPGSVEAYYQEVGRAGRDGARAIGLLLHGSGDLALRRRLLELPIDGRPPEPEVVEHKWGLYLELLRWIEGGSCRHDAILRYFGAAAEVLGGCGRCDECERADEPEPGASPEEVALVVRKALSAVARVHRRLGLGAAVKLLAGASDPRLERYGLESVSTFGALRDRPEPWLLRLLRRTVTAGWVAVSGEERPLAVLTPEGRAVMLGQKPARLLLPPTCAPRPQAGALAAAGGRGRRGAATEVAAAAGGGAARPRVGARRAP